jgi:hypothetical protein
MIITRIIENTAGSAAFLAARGQHVPTVNGLPNFGWTVHEPDIATPRGAVMLFPSVDGEDVEMLADGGWTAPSARRVFDGVFNRFGHDRLTARCPAKSAKNIRVLQRMGFKIEGIKRCPGGDIVLLGMLKSECRLLKRN